MSSSIQLISASAVKALEPIFIDSGIYALESIQNFNVRVKVVGPLVHISHAEAVYLLTIIDTANSHRDLS